MGIKIGGIDLADSVINLELRVLVLEKIVEVLMNQLGGTQLLSTAQFQEIRKHAMEALQQKYPDAGIEPKTP